MNDLVTTKPLALSLCDHFKQDRSILGKPVSQLAKMRGFTAEQIYRKLIPALMDEDLGERLRYAEVGLQLAQVIDKNRLREEVGVSFILSMDIIINIVKDGVDYTEGWIKRKAMKMYSYLLDENAEKTRFVESLLVEQKVSMIEKSQGSANQILQEILDFECKNGNMFEVVNVKQ